MEILIAEKGYDVNYMTEAAESVIPLRFHGKALRKYDKELYKERNFIERMFNRIKHFRRVATRYDKLTITFLSFIHVAAIYLWVK